MERRGPRADTEQQSLLPAVLLTELETHLHISDKAVGEFIIDTARSQSDVDEFKGVRSAHPCAHRLCTSPAHLNAHGSDA